MMKKFVLLLLVCFCGYSAMAELPINVGIHGGISSNRIKFKDIPQAIGTRANTGYMVGAFCRFNLGLIYLEPSLNFSHKKSIVELNYPNDSERTLKLNSFDIPLMVGVKIIDISLLKLRGYLGPVATFPKLKGIKDFDVSTKKTNWHGKVGVGVDVWKLTFDIDYEKGFSDLGHDLKSPRSFNFTLGLKLI